MQTGGRESESLMKSGRFVLAVAAIAFAAACGEKPMRLHPPREPNRQRLVRPQNGSLEWAVAGRWRIDAEKARDQYRHPVETLKFFGVKGSDTVVEIWPGGGWYTAILGPYLKAGGGKLYAAQMDRAPRRPTQSTPTRPPSSIGPRSMARSRLRPPRTTSPGIAPDGSADVVLTFRNVHNWMAGGYAEKMFADAYRALKQGGVLGIEEHRLPSARDQDLAASTGYVLESYVVQLAQKAGFVLEESSEINANPKDTADHPLGVWMLPPNLRAPAAGTPAALTYDAETYKAIGESDRMTLRFRKPATAAPAAPPAAVSYLPSGATIGRASSQR